MDHRHQPFMTTEIRCYVGGVARAPFTDENRAAHGSVAFRERCKCGATRAVNQNGRHREYGPWEPPERRFVGKNGSGKGFYVWTEVGTGIVVRVSRVAYIKGKWVTAGAARLSSVPREAQRALGIVDGRCV